jgi:hypothetical protein
VAYVFGSTPQQVLLDNQDSIKQPDQLLTDMTVLLCGINVPAATGSSSSGETPQQQQPAKQQQQQPAPQKPQVTAVPAAYAAPRPVVQQPPPVQQQQQQPATSVQLGVYKGTISCEGIPMQVNMHRYYSVAGILYAVVDSMLLWPSHLNKSR